jgi:hypothetical protein
VTRISEADLKRFGPGRKGRPKAAPRRGRENKWERAFREQVLEPERLAGLWEGYRFEPVTLTLYDGSTDVRKSRVTLDFFAWSWNDRPCFFEVKGHRRRGSIEKLKNAAQQYPMFNFCLVTGGPGKWEYQWL